MADEDWLWDLNPGTAAMQCLFGTTWLGQRRTRSLLGTISFGREELRTSISLSEIQYPGLSREVRKDCAFLGILKDFGISMKTLSYYS